MNTNPKNLQVISHPSRPLFHFTPPSGWMNDPNGLIKIGETYHLFYQHNPDGLGWGNIHWGHATSNDLIRWEHHPTAIFPDSLGMIFSGSVVRDFENSAGFGKDALIALFTQHGSLGQVQSLAWSTDEGLSWTMFNDNPVLVAGSPSPDFRDPKIIRSPIDGSWVMVLAVADRFEFYRSSDLKAWEIISLFRPEHSIGSILEVADLVELTDPNGEPTWVFIYSLAPPPQTIANLHKLYPDHYAQISPRAVYWVQGTFDWNEFVPTSQSNKLDHGWTFYASMVWAEEQHPPICIGWMDETKTQEVGGMPWCGRMSIPRRLVLKNYSDGIYLTQHPIIDLVGEEVVKLSANEKEEISIPSGIGFVKIESTILESNEDIEVHLFGPAQELLASLLITNEKIKLSNPLFKDSILPSLADSVEVFLIIDIGSIEVFSDDGRVVGSVVTNPIKPAEISINNLSKRVVSISHSGDFVLVEPNE